MPDHRSLFPKEVLACRWFLLPAEAKDLLFPSVFKKSLAPKKKKAKKGAPPEPEDMFFNWRKARVAEEDTSEINPVGSLSGEMQFSKPLGGKRAKSGKSPWLTEFRTGKVTMEEEEEEEEEVEEEEEEEKCDEKEDGDDEEPGSRLPEPERRHFQPEQGREPVRDLHEQRHGPR